MTLDFLLTSLVVVIAPGAGVLYTVGVGLARGIAASLAAALGCTLGIVPHMTAAMVGVAALLQASPLAFQVFKALGVAYLLWLAWSILRQHGGLAVSPEGDRKPLARIAMGGILINILNPKLSIFFLAFLPQFVPSDAAAPLSRMIGLSAVFMALTFVVFVGYGTFAARVRLHVIGRPAVMAWVRRGFAAAFALLALRLGLAG